MTTHSDLPSSILDQIQQYLDHIQQAHLLKREILAWAETNLALSEFAGETGNFYLGPDAKNERLILAYGNVADSAIQQMETAGVRSYKQPATPRKKSAAKQPRTKKPATSKKKPAPKQPAPKQRTVQVYVDGQVVTKPFKPAPSFQL